MAGRLTISTLNDDTGVLATQNGMSGIAKAWVNFNGTGTPAVLGSFNISSIARVSTGIYTVNFTTAMPNANYAVTTDAISAVFDQVCCYEAPATGSVVIKVQNGATGTFLDVSSVSVAIFR
jgi:hypothetical protein